MASIERTAYPRFGPNPSAKELSDAYTPTGEEIELARTVNRGEASVLGFLLMLKSFQRLSYFPRPEEVPDAVVSHLRHRLRLGPGIRTTPPLRSRSRYREAIRDHLGVKPYGDGARRSAAEAVVEAATAMDDPADLINVATNKAESYNAFSGWLFFGGDGVLSENDPDHE